MKTKSVKSLESVATIQRNFFPTIEGQTNGGKKCFALVTDLRLSTDNFKKLMADISLAGGYGFMKFHAETKKRFITVTGIDGGTLSSLAAQYEWTAPEPKVVKVAKKDITKQTGKGPNQTKTEDAKQQALKDIAASNPAILEQLLALLSK